MSVVEFYMYLRSTALEWTVMYFRSTAFEQTIIVRSKADGVKYMYAFLHLENTVMRSTEQKI